MTKDFVIRLINPDDARSTLEVYRPYVESTAISFEYDVPSLEEWKKRIENISTEYPWLVCEHDQEIIGYAYGSKHRYRTAYSWSAESTVYVEERFHRKGVARILYETLFALLRLQGYVNVYAGVTVPNPKSEAFHLSMGFYEVGTFRNIGFKHGAWHDTRWFQLHLVDHPEPPERLRTILEIIDTLEFTAILGESNSRLDNISR